MLDDEQLELVIGFILHQNGINDTVSSTTVQNWIKTNLKVNLSSTTILRLLKTNGFSYRTMQNKKDGFNVTNSSLAAVFLAWIEEFRPMIFRGVDHKNICSIDFTFTSHRTAASKTFAQKGVSQPKEGRAYTVYTNCLITCLWADGINHTPSIAFTLDPAFRIDRSMTPPRRKQAEYLKSRLSYYNLSQDRVVYVGKFKGEVGNYCGESANLVRRFVSYYQARGEFDPDCTILSDYGLSFKVGEKGNKIDVFTQLGFARRFFYPACMHQYLSPNDNRVHGAAKVRWRSKVRDHKNDVDSTLNLLYQLDHLAGVNTRSYFEKNFLLQFNQPTITNAMAVIQSEPKKICKFHDTALATYQAKYVILPDIA